jgi:hypothetical protein
MNFTWNIANWVKQVIPDMLRKSVQLAWLQVLLTPINTLFSEFKVFRKRIAEQMLPTGQTMSIEWRLNALFDPLHRRIFIKSANELVDQPYIYQSSEPNGPFYMGSKTTRRNSEYFTGNYFIVYVPAALISSQVAYEIRRYKLAGTTYTIQAI